MSRLAPVVLLSALLACKGAKERETTPEPAPSAESAPLPEAAPPPAESRLTIPPLTAEQRVKGFDECNPFDPLGLGPYAPFVPVSLGKMMIPQRGGHTPDMGYDVIVHFNGGDAARKVLTQVAKGVALVTVDRANGGGYTNAVATKEALPALRRSIESALRRHSGSEQAHVRHLGISAWSAGTQAVAKQLSHGVDGLDAVVILDGLHGAWKLGAPREQKSSSLDARFVKHEIEAMRRAQKGELIFVLTHSRVNPGVFPSTFATAANMLEELGLRPTAQEPGADPYGKTSALDDHGLHVWAYAGNDVKAHCNQLMQLGSIVSELIEPAWGTPAMDRSGPPTPLPGAAPAKR